MFLLIMMSFIISQYVEVVIHMNTRYKQLVYIAIELNPIIIKHCAQCICCSVILKGTLPEWDHILKGIHSLYVIMLY